jgi:cilia- and flagella-associated protein 100
LLKSNIDELRRKINAESDKADRLTRRTRSSNANGDHHAGLSKLSTKIANVYVQCGFDVTDSDTLDMLREIEGKLEDLLGRMKHMDPDVLARGEKEKESERRERVRIAKYEEQQRQYEERLAKANARAKAEVRRVVGKKIMFRSPPLQKKKKTKKKQTKKTEEEEDIRRFFT